MKHPCNNGTGRELGQLAGALVSVATRYGRIIPEREQVELAVADARQQLVLLEFFLLTARGNTGYEFRRAAAAATARFSRLRAFTAKVSPPLSAGLFAGFSVAGSGSAGDDGMELVLWSLRLAQTFASGASLWSPPPQSSTSGAL